ncbi:amidase [Parapusillimonas sp. SGNA-6]|nr:amidase [Parapusillimonas sp. SGNA-6]
MIAKELSLLSARDLGRLIEARQVSPVEVLESFFDRCASLNPALNAIVAMDEPRARAAAREAEARALGGNRLSPLDGVPVTVKDNLFVEGMRATWGSQLFRDFVPERDDISIARLRKAGVNIVAKTNTPEFSLGAYTDNLVHGVTRNPWDTSLTPGGSSGGAVSALAAGFAPLAIGTDAGGSIRGPAAYTGVVGLRPSNGRIPRAFGFPPLAHDFQVIAPAARTVLDVYELFRNMSGPDARDRTSLAFQGATLPAALDHLPLPRLRIRYVPSVEGLPVNRIVRGRVDAAARILHDLGHIMDEEPAPYSVQNIDQIWATLSASGLAKMALMHDNTDFARDLTSASLKTIERGHTIPASSYVDALHAVNALRIQFAAFFETTDILLTPTSPTMPWSAEQPFPASIDETPIGPRGVSIFTTFVNAAGLPAISLPCPAEPGCLPVGLQLVAPYGNDVTLLRLALEFESAAPWEHRRPALL